MPAIVCKNCGQQDSYRNRRGARVKDIFCVRCGQKEMRALRWCSECSAESAGGHGYNPTCPHGKSPFQPSLFAPGPALAAAK